MNDVEDIEDVDKGYDVGRITIVLPTGMLNELRTEASNDRRLIGEEIRDILRGYLERQENLIACEGKDCEALVDERDNYCSNCGQEIEYDEEEETEVED
jgi:plasmid stability protein